MRLAEVLRRIGAPKRFVHYLEARGHIRPRLVEKERIARRDYSEEDARRIGAIWAYHRRGVSVAAAVALVDQAERAYAYVLFQVPPRRWDEALGLLRGYDAVREAAVVYGENVDLVAKVGAPDDADVYAVLAGLVRAVGISSQPIVLRVSETREGSPGGGKVQAYVLVKASAKRIEETLESLRGLDGIVEAAAIYGETDVVCRVEVTDQDALDRLVMRELHAIPTVEATRTYIVVGGMSWRRAST